MTEPRSRIQDACRDGILRELDRIGSFREDGGLTLGYLCSGFPEALAAGLGFRPLRMLHGFTRVLEDAGGRMVRPDICPMIGGLLGGIESGDEPFSLVDVWMGLCTCDQTRRCFSLLQESVPVYTVQLPSTRSDSARDYYAEQLEDFVGHAARRAGLEYSGDRALKHFKWRRAAGRVLRQAALSGTVAPMDLHWLFNLYHIADPRRLEGELRSLLRLAEEYEPRFTIGLTGSTLVLEDIHIMQMLQERNTGVLQLGCTGLQSIHCEESDALPSSGMPGELARGSFQELKCPRSRPNDALFQYLENMTVSRGCRGLVVKTLKFCDLWFTERKRFRERISVPVLVTDTGYGQGEALRQRNRVEAFLDTLEIV